MMSKTFLTISILLFTPIGFATSYPGTNSPPYPNQVIQPYYYPPAQPVIDPRDDDNRILPAPRPSNPAIQKAPEPPSTASGP